MSKRNHIQKNIFDLVSENRNTKVLTTKKEGDIDYEEKRDVVDMVIAGRKMHAEIADEVESLFAKMKIDSRNMQSHFSEIDPKERNSQKKEYDLLLLNLEQQIKNAVEQPSRADENRKE